MSLGTRLGISSHRVKLALGAEAPEGSKVQSSRRTTFAFRFSAQGGFSKC